MDAATKHSQELYRAMTEAIGFLQGVLVHAFTPAFHRIPRMFERLGAEFSQSEEVQEVLDVMIRSMHSRLQQGVTGPRERVVLKRLEELQIRNRG
jgi:hypothetical protein